MAPDPVGVKVHRKANTRVARADNNCPWIGRSAKGHAAWLQAILRLPQVEALWRTWSRGA